MKLKILTVLALSAIMMSCGGDKPKEKAADSPAKEDMKAEVTKIDPMKDKGVGPIKSVTIGDIDDAMVANGEKIFKAKCTACHKISKRFVGPALKGITKKQTPEWIMNMILNPDVMVVENARAKELLIEYSAPMANQNLTEEEARAIYEYFRTKN
ncbi:MAG: c-type cytochrome [Flavobacteriaceae bacterium]|nr:c-type cytochrome [Flavobacteriaceae bacterium]